MGPFLRRIALFGPTSPLPVETPQYLQLISVRGQFWLMRRCAVMRVRYRQKALAPIGSVPAFVQAGAPDYQ